MRRSLIDRTLSFALALGLLIRCGLGASASADDAPPAPRLPGPTYITHVTIIDTETGAEKADQMVVIVRDRIAEIAASSAGTPIGARVVDGTGKFLIPGLWDMHVHGTSMEATLPLYVANGVTGVREMFGPPDANAFRAELASKHGVVPHIYLGSPIFDGDPPTWPDSIVVKTAAEARQAVDEQKKNGADFIKVYNGLSREAYFAIMDEARRVHIPVAGHPPWRVTVWEVIEAGQKTLEHENGLPFGCSTREEELQHDLVSNRSEGEYIHLFAEAYRSHDDDKCERLFAELKKAGTWVVPTLVVDRAFAMMREPDFASDARLRYFGGQAHAWLSASTYAPTAKLSKTELDDERYVFAANQRTVGALFRAGIPLLGGTDAMNPFCFPGFSLHDELALQVEGGQTPLAALQSVTRNAAQFMQATADYGSVTPGRIADLVLLDANPLVDIHNTARIGAVFLGGRELDRAALDQLLSDAEKAAQSPLADGAASDAATGS